MSKNGKHANNIPRRKRMTREQRLQSAKSTGFLSKHIAKDMVRHYARWYGVDLLCAIAELRQLGLEVSPEREEAVKTTLRNRLEQKRKTLPGTRLEERHMGSRGMKWKMLMEK